MTTEGPSASELDPAPSVSSELLREAFKLAPRVLPLALPFVYVGNVPGLMQDLMGERNWYLTGAGCVLRFAAQVVTVHLAVQAAANGAVSLSAAAAGLTRNLGRLLGASLLVELYALPLLLLGVIPGVVRLLSYLLVVPILLFEFQTFRSLGEVLSGRQRRMLGLRLDAFVAWLYVVGPPGLLWFARSLMAELEATRHHVPAPITWTSVIFDVMLITSASVADLLCAVLYLRTRGNETPGASLSRRPEHLPSPEHE